MGNEAYEKIKEAEEKAERIIEEARLYVTVSEQKAVEEKNTIFENKLAEAKLKEEEILKNARLEAQEILSSENDSCKKEINVLKQIIAEKKEALAKELIKLI